MAAPKKHGKGYTQISEHDFKLIKSLQELGLSRAQAARITKRAQSTISYIYGAEALAQYKEVVKQKYQRQIDRGSIKLSGDNHASDKEADQPETEFAKDLITDKKVDESVLEALARINSTLERLVYAWENQPNKKGWLK